MLAIVWAHRDLLTGISLPGNERQKNAVQGTYARQSVDTNGALRGHFQMENYYLTEEGCLTGCIRRGPGG